MVKSKITLTDLMWNFLKVKNLNLLIVGGGFVAEEKLRFLLNGLIVKPIGLFDYFVFYIKKKYMDRPFIHKVIHKICG